MNSIFRKHIASVIILVIISLVSLLGVIFLFYTMDTKINKVLETKELLSSYQKNNKAYTDESNHMKELEKRADTLEENIINEQTVPTFLSSLEILAQKGGAEFEITSVQNPVLNEKKGLVVDFSIRGSYAQVRLFLEQVQHQNYQIQFSNLELSLENQPLTGAPAQTITLGSKVATPIVSKEKQWRALGTINVISF